MSEPRAPHPLIPYLEGLAKREDRRALAMLRRSLSGDSVASAYPFVAPFFPRERNAGFERALLLVAGLFALHPRSGTGSLGRALHVLAARTKSESIESRFVALLDARGEDLDEHLRHLVSLLRAHDVPVDWDDLLRAIRWWDSERSDAPRRWARDFWATADAQGDENEADTHEGIES
ncbi:MAG: type I-E CRISPR-associated protein Cse2/CasB [Deltaproteobacteria bacterium]